MTLDQKPEPVKAFYKPNSASKLPCLLDFVAAASQLYVYAQHNDRCLSVNSAFALTDRRWGTVMSRTIVFQSRSLYLREKIWKKNFPGHKLIFTTLY